MFPPQTTYPIPPQVARPETPPPAHAQQQAGPEFNESFIEALAQRLMPRLMPEILYHVRAAVPPPKRDNPFGMSLALAIVSLVLMIPLIAIVLGDLTFLGIGAALVSKDAMAKGDWGAITANAKAFVEAILAARGSK